MTRIRIRPPWYLPESLATPEEVFVNRRTFLKQAAVAAGGAMLLPSIGCAQDTTRTGPLDGVEKYPGEITRNRAYDAGRPLTKDTVAAGFNNFYEFHTDKERVWKLVDKFQTKPWSLKIDGACKNKGDFDLDDILKRFPQEERVYRFRCVETWSMTVPWIGFPLKALIEWAEPTDAAKYVSFLTAWKPKEMPTLGGFRDEFPYYEGLRLDEAMNELTLCATGMYGRKMPKQNGAPLRIIAPWKYGYKSPKSIVAIAFTENLPGTFWNDYAPNEYGFFSNVNPGRAHPRWSQAKEWRIPNEGEKHDTELFNGYGEQVAEMYKGMDLIRYH